jgi:hypothetical protein
VKPKDFSVFGHNDLLKIGLCPQGAHKPILLRSIQMGLSSERADLFLRAAGPILMDSWIYETGIYNTFCLGKFVNAHNIIIKLFQVYPI